MRIAVVGSGVAGLGAAYVLSRAHEVQVFERDGRAGGHANTVDARRPGARHRLPRPQRAQLPAPRPAIRASSASRRTPRRCRSRSAAAAAGSSTRAGGRSRSRGTPRARGSSRCSGRSAAGCGRRRAASDESQSLARVPRRARLLGALPPPLPRAADVGALVDGARPRARVPGGVRDPLLRQPRHARLRALQAGARSRAGAGRTSTRSPTRLGAAAAARDAASARSGARADGVELRIGDGVERFDRVVIATHADEALALLEDPTRRRAARARRVRATRRTRRSSTPTRASSRARGARTRLVELPSRR